MTALINVQINGDSINLASDATVADVVALLKLQDMRIAVELNEAIVPRSQHAKVTLNENDVIEVVTAIGGG